MFKSAKLSSGRLSRRSATLFLGGIVTAIVLCAVGVLLGSGQFGDQLYGRASGDLPGVAAGGCVLGPSVKCPGANLSNLNAAGTDIRWADLNHANLYRTYFGTADMRWANLSYTDMRKTIMIGADMREINLEGANMSGVEIHRSDLRDANLKRADLSNSDLESVELFGTDLSGANLKGSNISERDLWRAKSLSGATMPDGSKHS